ncbi:MAG TPA: FAD-dependent thymidylate synthase, partial [Allocoleopsis sp.]
MSEVYLRGITSPIFDDSDGSPITAEELIAYAARVSNPSNQNNLETAPKLLKYLVKHQHWSPFEMVHVLIEINTTRDIGRQILRHRSFSFQEFSQRYAKASDLGFELREARLQDTKNRQNSIEINNAAMQASWEHMQNKVLDISTQVYQWALDQGVAKEQARAVLPEGLTRSRMYMSGTLRSWIHYILLRAGPETQKE